jgi:hypothetical protein
MLETSRDPDLAQKALQAQYCTQLWVKDLDGNEALMPEVFRAIHRCHTATTNLALHAISRVQRSV